MSIDEISDAASAKSFFGLRNLHSKTHSELAGLNLVSDENFQCVDASASSSIPMDGSSRSSDLESPDCTTTEDVDVKYNSTEVDGLGTEMDDHFNGSRDVEQEQRQQLDMSRTVFVGNIHFRANPGTIRKFFKKFGNVKTVFLVRRHGTRTHKRVAFVKFTKMESAKRAIEANEEEASMDNRHLRIFPANDKKMKLLSEQGSHADENREAFEECSVELDDDVLLLIFKYLNAEDLFNMEKVCKRWRNLAATTWASTKSLDFRNCFSPFKGKPFSYLHLRRILKQCGSSLKSLDISTVAGFVDNDAIDHIAKMCPNLEELDFSGLHSRYSSTVLLGKGCSKLQKIICNNSDAISEKELWSLINKCQNLKYLDVSNNLRITGKCFHRFGPNMQVLKINNCKKIGSSGFQEMASRCPELVELCVNSASKTIDENFRLICTSCVKLTKLDLSGRTTNVCLDHLCNIKELKYLEELYLSENQAVKDELLLAVSEGCKELRVLDLSACSHLISDSGVESLAECLKLAILNISYLDAVTHVSLVKLSTSCPLEQLTTRGCPSITDAGFQSVINLCPRLKSLDLSGCDLVTEAILRTARNVIANRDNGIKLELIVGGTRCLRRPRQNEHPLLDINSFDYCSDSLRPTYSAMYDDDEFYPDEDYAFEDHYYDDNQDDYGDYHDDMFDEKVEWLS